MMMAVKKAVSKVATKKKRASKKPPPPPTLTDRCAKMSAMLAEMEMYAIECNAEPGVPPFFGRIARRCSEQRWQIANYMKSEKVA